MSICNLKFCVSCHLSLCSICLPERAKLHSPVLTVISVPLQIRDKSGTASNRLFDPNRQYLVPLPFWNHVEQRNNLGISNWSCATVYTFNTWLDWLILTEKTQIDEQDSFWRIAFIPLHHNVLRRILSGTGLVLIKIMVGIDWYRFFSFPLPFAFCRMRSLWQGPAESK